MSIPLIVFLAVFIT